MFDTVSNCLYMVPAALYIHSICCQRCTRLAAVVLALNHKLVDKILALKTMLDVLFYN